MRAALFVVVSCWAASSAGAAAPNKNDYAMGANVTADSAQPMIEVSLPDEIYGALTREDLGDVRVFNAEGMPVPHAFCASTVSAEPTITEQSLQVFMLRDRQLVRPDGTRVDVETSSGTRVGVQESAGPTAQVVDGQIHIIDARGATDPLRAIRFDWRSPDDASAVKVRVEASRDLDQWQTIVPASTLLLVRQGDRELRRERIELPTGKYEYLRVQRIDGGPPLAINSVTAEQVIAGEETEPLWFSAMPGQSDETESLLFDAQRVAPVTYARLRLPQPNSSVSVEIQSRADHDAQWRTRWRGESYLIVKDTIQRESPPAKFQSTSDRYWRVRILKDPQVYRASQLELGYRPARLRFLAQGAGPFTIAVGSRRAELAQPAQCDGLLADVSATDRERMVGQGYVGSLQRLGGPDALKPLPQKTSFKVVVLWAVLVIGVAMVVAMAVSLLGRIRKPPA